ncbi:MAG: DUF1684 domain-containing protein [Gemmatimonadota bacterium]|uniref:DUF1684 domain-containing protein n=1 Tax=Candidatus Palauibacter scopulicola TaxID=3056741 RepID=UPI002391838C|nr:DUF1684 domain-containing protein [Candidatus Palauibacter scopulicola]MDE2662023.1 DUF1684 domain-containing protein [Candidatus Palauibacter scopulicola]
MAAEHEEWREGRRRSLANPNAGVISWDGLFELREGANTLGSDRSAAIVLPEEDAPPLAGTLYLEDGVVRLVPEAGSGLHVREPVTGEVGETVTEPMPLPDDRSEGTVRLALGSLGMRVHAEPGTERLWLRVWDTDAPRLAAFELPGYFPITNDWRVTARFEPYPEPRTVSLADVRGGTLENTAPGDLVFRVDGAEHRLMAFAGASSRSYFISLWDSTAVTDTYQAGRYMRAPLAGDDGWTTIDFNRTYNAPCAFTPHSVCSLPPPENYLRFPVTAGEKRP